MGGTVYDPQIRRMRIEPNLAVGAYQTYTINRRRDTTVKTACETVGCAAWLHGWESAIDETTELGQRQAAYIRTGSGRTFTEHRSGDGLTVFRFASRQRCFAEHRTHPEAYGVLGGDWRGYTGLIRRHTRPVDWVEDMGEQLDAIADNRKEG